MYRSGPLLMDRLLHLSGRVVNDSRKKYGCISLLDVHGVDSFANNGERRRKLSSTRGRVKNEPQWISRQHVIVIRADLYDCPPHNFKNDWHNCRYFGSNTKDGKQSPDNLASASQITEPIDPSTKIKPKIRYSKEYIDALKSEVEEMESSSPSSNSNPTNTQRTPDDFADYLKDLQPLIPGSAPFSNPDNKEHNAPNKADANIKLATDVLGTVPVYQYKFKSSDALVSIAATAILL
jgi:hypothetical protein